MTSLGRDCEQEALLLQRDRATRFVKNDLQACSRTLVFGHVFL